MSDEPRLEGEIDLESIVSQIDGCQNQDELESIRVHWLGKQGLISKQLKQLGAMSPEQRATKAPRLNQAKAILQQAIKARHQACVQAAVEAQLKAESCDITLPGRVYQNPAQMHPVMDTQIRLIELFQSLGFQLIGGDVSQEVETEYYNFSALNIPDTHPARAMHDTFYLENGQLLRTHTSPVQIRVLKSSPELPLRMITPGKVFRCDSDQTHTPMFHQMEGLVIDESCHFGHLKSLIETVLTAFFGQPVCLRFRPSYFPFTEPSAEVDIQWPISGGGETQWLEVLGCGMVHSNVLRECHVDCERYRGYAFGFGLDRLTLLKYGVQDLRSFFSGDLDFLTQFSLQG